jgi:hypothetical protein
VYRNFDPRAKIIKEVGDQHDFLISCQFGIKRGQLYVIKIIKEVRHEEDDQECQVPSKSSAAWYQDHERGWVLKDAGPALPCPALHHSICS